MSSVAALFGKPLHSIPKASNSLAVPDAKVGIEVEVEKCYMHEGDVPGTDLWSAKVDGSLRDNGMEFVTNGGLVGEQIEESVKWLCSTAIKKKFSEGYPRAGIHVHLDVTDMNSSGPYELATMLQTAMILEAPMFGFAGEHRRACGFCDAFSDSNHDFEHLSKVLFDWPNNTKELLREDRHYLSKYQAINLLPISRYGTVEFRHLPTTFNPERILNWINIILSIKKFAMSYKGDVTVEAQRLGPIEFCNLVLGDWGKVLIPFCSERAHEDGIITAKLIRLRTTVKAFTPKVKKADWPGKPSAIMARKISALLDGKPKPEDLMLLELKAHLKLAKSAVSTRGDVLQAMATKLNERIARLPAERVVPPPPGGSPSTLLQWFAMLSSTKRAGNPGMCEFGIVEDRAVVIHPHGHYFNIATDSWRTY